MLGLRTCIYKVIDLKKATEWYAKAFGETPYFVEDFYVGFNIGGFELGLLPEEKSSESDNVLTYWGVEDIRASYDHFLACGATAHEEPNSVGENLWVASVWDPWGNCVGLIYNPHFSLD